MRHSAAMPRTCWQGRPCHRDLRTRLFREGRGASNLDNWSPTVRAERWQGKQVGHSAAWRPQPRCGGSTTASRRGCGCCYSVEHSAACLECFIRGSTMAPLRRSAVLRHQECKRRCTRIRRDERGWYAWCGHRFWPKSMRPFALSLLIRVNLRFHFFCPRSAHTHQVGEVTPGPETAPSSSRGGHQIAVLAQVVWSGRLRA